jgi:hypothetical protein
MPITEYMPLRIAQLRPLLDPVHRLFRRAPKTEKTATSLRCEIP